MVADSSTILLVVAMFGGEGEGPESFNSGDIFSRAHERVKHIRTMFEALGTCGYPPLPTNQFCESVLLLLHR